MGFETKHRNKNGLESYIDVSYQFNGIKLIFEEVGSEYFTVATLFNCKIFRSKKYPDCNTVVYN